MKTTDRQLKCRSLFEQLGYPVSGASALVGNFCRESGEDLPTAFRKTHLDHGSQGLAQWRLGRLTNLEAFVTQRHPKDATAWLGNMGEQVAFVDHELRTDYPALREKLTRGGDVAALTADVCWQYERPSKALSGIDLRIAYAKALAAVDLKTSPKPSPGDPLGLGHSLASAGVVDHLQVEAATHVKQQTGGAVLAGMGTLLGTGTLLTQAIGTVPVWELAAGGVAGLAIAFGIISAAISGHKASDVRSAIAGVTPDAPPADQVEHTPVVVPADPAPVQDMPMTAEEVERIVRNLMAAQTALGAETPLVMRVPASTVTRTEPGGGMPVLNMEGTGVLAGTAQAHNPAGTVMVHAEETK